MKILHVLPTRSKKYGGPVRVAEAIAKKMQLKGHHVEIFPKNDSTNGSLNKNTNYWPGFIGLTEMYQTIKKVDIIHIHSLWTLPTSFAATFARRLNRPYIIRTCGMLNYLCVNKSYLKKKLYAFIWEDRNIKNASALHFLNRFEQEESIKYNLPALISPNGVNIDDFDNLSDRNDLYQNYPQLKNKILVFFLGRLHPIKGLDILIPAFAKAQDQVPSLYLIIAGPDEDGYQTAVEAMAEEANIEKAISIVGEIHGEEKRNFFSAADFFILPSYHEADSSAIKEALASRLPVIITENCHFPEVENKKAGIVVPSDVTALFEAIKYMGIHTDKREEMGKNAYMMVNRYYRWDAIVDNLLNEYQKIISDHLN